jgi:predicted AAA+ superfamily ATPase
VVYVNFDRDKKLQKLFEADLNPKRIIGELAIEVGKPISHEDTLIIFDEIQECYQALLSLKYFCEDAPEYHLVGAGSLLGVAIHQRQSFPSGQGQYPPFIPSML